MRKFKKLLVIMFTLIFTVTLFSGCGSDKEKNKKGRYIEEDYSMPEGISYLIDMKILENGKLALLGQPESSEEERFEVLPLKYFESSDYGKTWNEVNIKLPEKNGDNTIYYNNGTITKDGKFILSVTEYTPEDIEEINEQMKLGLEDNFEKENSEEANTEDDVQIYEEGEFEDYNNNNKWVVADKDGNIKELSNDELKEYYEVKTDNNGNAYFLSYDPSKVVQVDLETGKVKNTFADKADYISSYIPLGDSLLVSTFEETIKYNIESGKEEGKIEALSNQFGSYYIGEDDKTIYEVGDKGVYSYKLGNEVLEKLVEGTMSTFGDSNYYLQSFVATKDDEFLAAFSNWEDDKMVLKHYYFSKDVASKPDNEITIYSLYENEYIEQAIVKYQKEHPDVYINYEIGIDYNSTETITVDDAIKALNTEIMAGKGPDLINLSYLPLESYIDKGLLDDISGILDSLNKEDLFTNVLTHGSKDDKVYAIPAIFNISLLFNKTDKEIKSLSDLANNVKAIKESYSGDLLQPINADEILYYFYRNCESSLLNDDNSLNKDALKEFLNNIKTIYDEAKDSHSDAIIKSHDENLKMFEEYKSGSKENGIDKSESFAKFFYSYGGDYISAYSEGGTAVNIAHIYSPEDFATIYSGAKTCNVKFNVWSGMGDAVVTPNVLIGLCSKSENKETATDFINALFTEEYQSMGVYSGIPLNKNSLKYEINVSNMIGGSIVSADVSGNEIQIEYKELSDEEINEIVSLIESYNGWEVVDYKIIDETIEDMTSYVEGKISIDDAISNIDKKLKVYLSE